MKRRNFIKNTLYSSAALASTSILTNSCNNDKLKKITILHTNDVHSHIDPFDKDNDKFAFKGGVSRRATIIEKIRKENSNTLLLDAGDIFQGTPYFNYYGGELEFKLMSMLKYDLATLGNHDFDNGIDGLYKQLPNANFNFVSANYDFKNTILDTIVKPYQIFYKDGIKIGIFGLGIRSNLFLKNKISMFTELMGGVAGGAGVDTGEGVLIRPTGGFNYHISDSLTFNIAIGQTSTPFGNSTGLFATLDICISYQNTVQSTSPPIPAARAARSVITP